MTLFSAIGTTLKTAQDSIKVVLESRDLIKNAPLLQQISSAQQSVLSLQAQLFELQNKYLETAEELTKLKKSITQRNRYALVEISKGVFVYRLRASPESGGAVDPSTAEPEHHICQRCMDDKGIRSILMLVNGIEFFSLRCTVCGVAFRTSERIPPIEGPSSDFSA